MRINPNLFEGKTIKAIKNDCINMVEFQFTDGSVVHLETEVQNSIGIPTIFSSIPASQEICRTCQTGGQAVCLTHKF